MKNCRIFTLTLILTLLMIAGVKPPQDTFAAGFTYVDGVLSSNCTANYSIANRDCSGSDGDAYTSIEEAVNAAQPGDIIQVREGIYHEQVDIEVDGTAAARIIIQNYPGETPVLDGSDVLTGWTQCAGDDPHLTVQGTVNSHYADIYRTSIKELPASQDPDVANLVVLYEDGDFMLPAQGPNQSMFIQDTLLYTPIEEESVDQTEYLIDSDYFTQADDYWVGADVWVWLHRKNNNIELRRIVSSSLAQHSITFAEALSAPLSVAVGSNPDAYSIYNHPHLLDQPGEYYYTTNPDGNGDYWLYVWPRETDHLTGSIAINKELMGFFPHDGDYVTIDGFEIRGFSGNGTRNGGVIVPAYFDHTGLHVENCYIHHNYGDAININDGVDDLIAGNTLDMNYGGGLRASRHTNLIIKNNIIRNHGSTNISFNANERMEIIGNRIGGFLGTHGNGMALYEACNNVLVADNVIAPEKGVPLTFNIMGNLVLVNNVLYAEASTRVIASWSMGTGYHLAFNNLILGADTTSAAYFRTAGDKVFRNNIVDGGALSGDGALESTYNMYTAFAWDQPVLHPTEIDAQTVTKTELFQNYPNFDLHLKESSPARNAGVSAGDVIQDYGLTTLFPSYDFYADWEGNPRPANGSWDLGPYQFVPSLQLHANPDDQAIHLTWDVNTTLPVTSTWRIEYLGTPGDQASPITAIISPTRSYNLTGLTNYEWYSITLYAMTDTTPIFSDTLRVMPTGIFVYLPALLRAS